MRKLVLGMFVSLDGFVSGPNGETDWIFRSGDDATDEWIINNLWEAGVLAMGSRSFFDMAAFWPTSDMPFAAPMNAIPKVVFTRKGLVDASAVQATTDTKTVPVEASGAPEPTQPAVGSRPNPIVARGDLSDEVARLKAERDKDIRVLGGASLAQDLAAHGLIDEYRLPACPVAPGQAVPLFSGLSKPLDLHLVSARTFNGGAIALVYHPAKDRADTPRR